jgi:hypothetical protein
MMNELESETNETVDSTDEELDDFWLLSGQGRNLKKPKKKVVAKLLQRLNDANKIARNNERCQQGRQSDGSSIDVIRLLNPTVAGCDGSPGAFSISDIPLSIKDKERTTIA